jgi:hypothetical protein
MAGHGRTLTVHLLPIHILPIHALMANSAIPITPATIPCFPCVKFFSATAGKMEVSPPDAASTLVERSEFDPPRRKSQCRA